MPYDPRAAQLTQMGIGMLGQQFAPPGTEQPRPQQPQRPKQWWEMMPQMRRPAQSDQSANSAYSPNSSKQPSLLDMLMLGGQPPQGGTGGGAPSGSYGAIPGIGKMNPWS